MCRVPPFSRFWYSMNAITRVNSSMVPSVKCASSVSYVQPLWKRSSQVTQECPCPPCLFVSSRSTFPWTSSSYPWTLADRTIFHVHVRRTKKPFSVSVPASHDKDDPRSIAEDSRNAENIACHFSGAENRYVAIRGQRRDAISEAAETTGRLRRGVPVNRGLKNNRPIYLRPSCISISVNSRPRLESGIEIPSDSESFIMTVCKRL